MRVQETAGDSRDRLETAGTAKKSAGVLVILDPHRGAFPPSCTSPLKPSARYKQLHRAKASYLSFLALFRNILYQ